MSKPIKPIFNLLDSTRVHTIWMVVADEANAMDNWLALVLKQENAPWEFRYRLRGKNDKKSWMSVTNPSVDDGPEKLVKLANDCAEHMRERLNGLLEIFPMHTDGTKTGEFLLGQPWAKASPL